MHRSTLIKIINTKIIILWTQPIERHRKPVSNKHHCIIHIKKLRNVCGSEHVSLINGESFFFYYHVHNIIAADAWHNSDSCQYPVAFSSVIDSLTTCVIEIYSIKILILNKIPTSFDTRNIQQHYDRTQYRDLFETWVQNPFFGTSALGSWWLQVFTAQ